MNETQNPYTRPRKPFNMLGKTYYFEFIPAIHFTDIFEMAMDLLLAMDVVGKEVQLSPEAIPQLKRSVSKLLREKVYEILTDVLKYQNGETITLDRLQHGTSGSELATFIALLVNDPETFQTVEALSQGMGEFVEKTLPQYQTLNFTPSLSSDSELTEQPQAEATPANA